MKWRTRAALNEVIQAFVTFVCMAAVEFELVGRAAGVLRDCADRELQTLLQWHIADTMVSVAR
jgi:hypothetical protein